MDGDAFLFMFLSWALILGLDIFCFTLLFMKPSKPQPVSARDVDKFDEEEEIT